VVAVLAGVGIGATTAAGAQTDDAPTTCALVYAGRVVRAQSYAEA
jgi:hypothetical protein